MKVKIFNKTGRNYSELELYLQNLYSFAQKQLKFEQPASIWLSTDMRNGQNILGKTAYYDPNEKKIVLYVDLRHPKDILRSCSHELVHHAQNCRGNFENLGEIGEMYAQEDDFLRNMESEAYINGNGLIFRDWEDKIKQNNGKLTENKGLIMKNMPKKPENDTKKPEKAPKSAQEALHKVKNERIYDELMRKWFKKEKKTLK